MDDMLILQDGVQTRADIRRDWYRLIEVGPRFPGTPNEKKAQSYLVDQLKKLPLTISYHEYPYLGWVLKKPPYMKILEPEVREIHCQAYIYCGPTPSQGVVGTAEYVGEHWVIGDYRWEKLAIRDSQGVVAAYISGRPDGPAMPQPLSERSEIMPHFSIGTEDFQQILAWLRAGRQVIIEGEIDVELNPRARSHNVIASYSPPHQGETPIVLCAHIDSMYICPGANDNAGGVSALLALARHYAHVRPNHPVHFLFFNGEEWELAGAKAYAQAMVAGEGSPAMKLMINLDGISEMQDSLQVWVGPEGFEADLKKVIDGFDVPRSVKKIYKFPPPLGADHVPFYNLGVPVIMFTGYDMVKYHLPIDTFWEGGVDNIIYVAELTRHIIDHFARRDMAYPTREAMLAPYRDSAAEGRLSFKLV